MKNLGSTLPYGKKKYIIIYFNRVISANVESQISVQLIHLQQRIGKEYVTALRFHRHKNI